MRTKPRFLRPAIAALLIAAAGGAFAQQLAEDRPNAVRIDDRVRRITPVPDEAAPAAPPIPDLLAPVAPSAPVVLGAITIEGATVFTAEELGLLYDGYLARALTEQEIEALLGRITKKYRDAGYVLSRAVAPPQALEAGVLRIQVIEGYIARVLWDDADFRGRESMQPYLAPVLNARPLTLGTLERALLLLNDLPGITVKPDLRPTAEDPAAYELVLSLEQKAVDAAALFDNRGTRSSGPWQALASVGLNNALGQFERIQLTAFSTPFQPKEVKYGALRYEQPVGTAGTWLSIGGAYTDAKPGSSLAGDDLRSSGFRVSAKAKQAVLRRRDQSLWTYGTFEFYETKQTSEGDGVVDDRMRVVRAGLEYILRDGLRGRNRFELETSKGLPVLNASRSAADGGRNDFWKVSAQATRQQRLAESWAADLSVAAQKSADRLVSAEEFSLGGTPFGRAYDPSEFSGEDGVAGSVELRFEQKLDYPFLKAYNLYGFSDIGVVWDRSRSGNDRRKLASAGVGARVWLRDEVEAGLEVAVPLSRGTDHERYEPRLFVSVSSSF